MKDLRIRRERSKQPFTCAELVRIRCRLTALNMFCFEKKSVLEISEFLHKCGYHHATPAAIRKWLNTETLPLLGQWVGQEDSNTGDSG